MCQKIILLGFLLSADLSPDENMAALKFMLVIVFICLILGWLVGGVECLWERMSSDLIFLKSNINIFTKIKLIFASFKKHIKLILIEFISREKLIFASFKKDLKDSAPSKDDLLLGLVLTAVAIPVLTLVITSISLAVWLWERDRISNDFNIIVNYDREVNENFLGHYDYFDPRIFSISDDDKHPKIFYIPECVCRDDEHGIKQCTFKIFSIRTYLTVGEFDDKVVRKMYDSGFRPATLKELLAFEEENPKKYDPIIALGSPYHLWDSRLFFPAVGGFYPEGSNVYASHALSLFEPHTDFWLYCDKTKTRCCFLAVEAKEIAK